ncbi:MAG: patatin-like phospholipase family protein [bacterium]
MDLKRINFRNRIKFVAIVLLLIIVTLPTSVFAEKRIGIVLSGGSALGYAHVGALQALEDYGIKPQYVAGTSMGAIIGAFYAAGYTPQQILQLIQDKKLNSVNKLLSPQSAFFNTGVSSHDVLISTMKELIPHNSFDSLELDFSLCVTNLDKGYFEYKTSGDNLAQYVAASASIPGVFETQVIDGINYVDGGILNNLPAEVLHDKKCQYIIGVDVIPFVEDALDAVKQTSPDRTSLLNLIDLKQNSNSLDVMMWSLRLVQVENSKPGREYCDWVIDSYAILDYHEFNFSKYIEIYQYGYKAVVDYIRSHPQMLKKLK